MIDPKKTSQNWICDKYLPILKHIVVLTMLLLVSLQVGPVYLFVCMPYLQTHRWPLKNYGWNLSPMSKRQLHQSLVAQWNH